MGLPIFILRHEYELDGYDQMHMLGVYSDQSIAEAAQERFSKEPGYRDHPNGFVIHESEIDKDLVSGGFVVYYLPPK